MTLLLPLSRSFKEFSDSYCRRQRCPLNAAGEVAFTLPRSQLIVNTVEPLHSWFALAEAARSQVDSLGREPLIIHPPHAGFKSFAISFP